MEYLAIAILLIILYAALWVSFYKKECLGDLKPCGTSSQQSYCLNKNGFAVLA